MCCNIIIINNNINNINDNININVIMKYYY